MAMPDWLKSQVDPATPLVSTAAVDPPPTTLPPPPVVLSVPAGSIDAAALAEAERAGMTSPATISDNAQPEPSEMHLRIQALEALVAHLFQTYARNVNLGEIVDAWISAGKATPVVIDSTVKGRV